MRWHRGAAIDGEPLMLTQGGDLPLILFVGTVNKSGAVDDRAATSLLALDKATGRTILRRDDLKQAGGASCRPYVADAAKHQAAIELSGRVITLQFTAERRPPAPPAIGAVEKNGEQTKGAIGRIFGLGLGGGEGEDN